MSLSKRLPKCSQTWQLASTAKDEKERQREKRQRQRERKRRYDLIIALNESLDTDSKVKRNRLHSLKHKSSWAYFKATQGICRTEKRRTVEGQGRTP